MLRKPFKSTHSAFPSMKLNKKQRALLSALTRSTDLHCCASGPLVGASDFSDASEKCSTSSVRRTCRTTSRNCGSASSFARCLMHFASAKCTSTYEHALLRVLTPFQRCVLLECARIPCGQTITYAELARRAGKPRAARAVGNALAKNPLAPSIPCHRVIKSDGKLGGYSAKGGQAKKRLLLNQEMGKSGRSI